MFLSLREKFRELMPFYFFFLLFFIKYSSSDLTYKSSIKKKKTNKKKSNFCRVMTCEFSNVTTSSVSQEFTYRSSASVETSSLVSSMSVPADSWC